MNNDDMVAEPAAIARLARLRGLTGGAAEAMYYDAVATGKVRRDALFAGRYRDRLPPAPSVAMTLTLSDIRVNWQDLAGAVPAQRKARREKPEQTVLNAALLKHAKGQKHPLKASADPEGRQKLLGLGAKTRQITKAYRALPPQYRHTAGNPHDK